MGWPRRCPCESHASPGVDQLARFSGTVLASVLARYVADSDYRIGDSWKPWTIFQRAQVWQAALSAPYDLFVAFTFSGMTTPEAMSAGCVPVVIRKGGQPEIVRHGLDGFLWGIRCRSLEPIRGCSPATRACERGCRRPRRREPGSSAARSMFAECWIGSGLPRRERSG